MISTLLMLTGWYLQWVRLKQPKYRVETHARLASLTLLVYEAGCVNPIICLHNAADSLDLLQHFLQFASNYLGQRGKTDRSSRYDYRLLIFSVSTTDYLLLGNDTYERARTSGSYIVIKGPSHKPGSNHIFLGKIFHCHSDILLMKMVRIDLMAFSPLASIR